MYDNIMIVNVHDSLCIPYIQQEICRRISITEFFSGLHSEVVFYKLEIENVLADERYSVMSEVPHGGGGGS